jgi:predicted SAM-dependent methyltransferase
MAGIPLFPKLNLGSGRRKLDGFVNVDKNPSMSPDLVHDVEVGLPFQDNVFDEVRAHDFLEHIHPDKVIFVMEEIWRVLRPNGVLDHFTPSTCGLGAFQDPTHRSFWNRNSWFYYCDDAYRALYNIAAKFEGRNEDINTGYGVIHTRGRLRAVK